MPSKTSQSIIIVGAGPIGLCCAMALAEAGQGVTIIDSGARGAGWASGGMLGAVYETLNRVEVPDILTDMAFESLALWQSLAVRLALETMAETIFVARSSDEARFLATLAEHPRASLAIVDMPRGFVGLAAWQCGHDLALHPRTALHALRKACVAAGVTFVIGDVTACQYREVKLRDRSSLSADTIILATGQGCDALRDSIPELACITPVKGQLLAVAPTALAQSYGAGSVVRAGRLYLIPRGHHIVIGATSHTDDNEAAVIDTDAHAALYHEAVDLCPTLKGAPIVESWAGLRPMTPDGLPMIGLSSVEGVIVACGTYRNGWLLAPALAQSIVDLVQDDDSVTSKLQPFSPIRFPI